MKILIAAFVGAVLLTGCVSQADVDNHRENCTEQGGKVFQSEKGSYEICSLDGAKVDDWPTA